jgi:nitrite reductase (NADH) small subunit
VTATCEADAVVSTATWVAVCTVDDVQRERGVCAIVAGRQIAILRTHDDEWYAVGQRDPFSGAFVMSRGIVGTRTVEDAEVPVVQSPLYKQPFDLRTGRCLDDRSITLPVYAVRISDCVVEVRA